MRSSTLTSRTRKSGKCSRMMATAAMVSRAGTSPQQAITTSGECSPSFPAHSQIPMPAARCRLAALMLRYCGAGCLPALTTLTTLTKGRLRWHWSITIKTRPVGTRNSSFGSVLPCHCLRVSSKTACRPLEIVSSGPKIRKFRWICDFVTG